MRTVCESEKEFLEIIKQSFCEEYLALLEENPEFTLNELISYSYHADTFPNFVMKLSRNVHTYKYVERVFVNMIEILYTKELADFTQQYLALSRTGTRTQASQQFTFIVSHCLKSGYESHVPMFILQNFDAPTSVRDWFLTEERKAALYQAFKFEKTE